MMIYFDEWHEFLQDDELYDMILDNLSLSQLESSVLEENASDSDNDDMLCHQQYWQQ